MQVRPELTTCHNTQTDTTDNTVDISTTYNIIYLCRPDILLNLVHPLLMKIAMRDSTQ